jgi:hypothetical protein
VAARQVPLPSQVREEVSVPPVHAAAAHDVPAACRRQAPLPSHMPSRPQVDAASAAHSLRGSVPALAGMQAPSAPVALQVMQRPVHAVWQHTPSTQKFELHSPALVQAAPFGKSPEQVPFEQNELAMQSPLSLQRVAQRPPAQTYGSHAFVVAGRHAPSPSQVRCELSTPATQLSGAQAVPAACSRQAPLPSHMPSRAQVDGASSGHSLAGSSPAAIGMQDPSLPGRLHATQAPPQAAPQQTPSTQNPEAHCSAWSQVAPSGLRASQAPLAQ